jgi:alpha-D-xyloside xylohydrolase
MRLAVACAALALWSTSALAGEARQVPHGMEVTTDAGETVRVLAYADGTFRVTVAKVLPEGRPTEMVVAEPDGEPTFSANAEIATLRMPQSSAVVGLSDGRLTVYDAADRILLAEYAPARRLTPVTIEDQPWLATRVQFNRGTDEGLYGLGQHQNRQMNYNGEDVELAQHNMAIAVPYLLSTRGYGVLWDNASITRVGDPSPYAKLRADAGLGLTETRESSGKLRENWIDLPGWDADYYLGDKLVAQRLEESIDYQYIRDQQRWPEEATAATVAATTGQNTAGNAAQAQRVIWSGHYTPETGGIHKFRLYSSSYVKVFANGKEVLSR